MDNKLKLCGYNKLTSQGNRINIEFHYDKNAIYINIVILKTLYQLTYFINQLLGRFKTRKFIVIQGKWNDNFLNILKNTKNITINVQNSDIIIKRCDYPKIYHGVIGNCTIDLIQHKQIIQITKDDMFIYFDPPLIFEKGDLSALIITPVAICGDVNANWKPKWKKLEMCTGYAETKTYIYGPKTYIVKSKMKISSGPSKYMGYENEFKKYQRYAKQVSHYLNNQAKRIQRAWRKCTIDPSYKICRDRLMREYNELVLV
jgi:hypothetical protein